MSQGNYSWLYTLEKLFYVSTRRCARKVMVHNYKNWKHAKYSRQETGKSVMLSSHNALTRTTHSMDGLRNNARKESTIFSTMSFLRNLRTNQNSILFRDTYVKTLYKGNERLRRLVALKV